MLFIAKTDSKQYRIEVKESRGQWEVSLTDTKTEQKETCLLNKTDFQQVGEVISLIFENRSYLIDIVAEGDDYTVFTKGSHKTIHLLTEERMLYNELAGAGEAMEEELMKSGMPGKVVEVRAKEGDQVKEGDLLLVMEAMKMENEIRAGRGGEVKKVYAREGQSVETGSRLILLKTKG